MCNGLILLYSINRPTVFRARSATENTIFTTHHFRRRVIMLMNRNSRKGTQQGASCFDAYTQSEYNAFKRMGIKRRMSSGIIPEPEVS